MPEQTRAAAQMAQAVGARSRWSRSTRLVGRADRRADLQGDLVAGLDFGPVDQGELKFTAEADPWLDFVPHSSPAR